MTEPVHSQKEALYLVCGLMSDKTVWKAQLAALSQRFDVRVINFPGFDSIPAMAASVLDELPDRFSLAGHSMGGRVALEIYRSTRDRVTRLALLDTGIYPAHDKEPGMRQHLVDLAVKEGMAGVAREWIPTIIHPDRLHDVALVRALEAMALRNTPDSVQKQIHALLTRPDMRDLLEQIDCPTLVLCGRQDGWVTPEQHEEMASCIADSELAIIEDCGHMTTMERPRQLTRLLLQWSERGGSSFR